MNNLLRLLARRLVWLPIMVVGVSFLVFSIMWLSPIDPAYSALGETAAPEALEDYRIRHHLNEPFFVQYGLYLWGMLHGDLGTFGVSQYRVSDEIAKALPLTLQLTFLGLIIAVLISFPLGVIAALYRDRWPDQLIRVISVISIGTPSFWLAALLVLQFVGTSIPVSGEVPAFSDDPSGWFLRMILPAIALAVPVIGQMTRVVRTSMVEELDRDYVRTAIGAGIPKTVVVARNVLRNALITPVTVLGLPIGYLMGGAVVIEIIFAIDGMGKIVLLKGIQDNSVALVQGGALVVAIAFIIVNIIVDMLYLLINPRIRSV